MSLLVSGKQTWSIFPLHKYFLAAYFGSDTVLGGGDGGGGVGQYTRVTWFLIFWSVVSCRGDRH